MHIEFDIRCPDITDAGLRLLYRELKKVALFHTVSVNFDPIPNMVTSITRIDPDKARRFRKELGLMKCGIAAELESDLGRDQYAKSVKFNPRLGTSTSTSTDRTH